MRLFNCVNLLIIALTFNTQSVFSEGISLEIPPVSGLKVNAITDHGLYRGYRDLAEVVIVIDKSEIFESDSGQTLTLFKNGRFLKRYTISTGAETIKKPHKDLDYTYLATTPTGYFRPVSERVYEVYHSNTWGGAAMPYSVFFVGGIAIHGTNDINNLAENVSGGCVRMFNDHAKEIRDAVLDSGSTKERYLLDASVFSKYDESVILQRSRIAGNMVSVPKIDRFSGKLSSNNKVISWDTVVIVGEGKNCSELPNRLCF